ncbi:MAG: hypothetical protein HYV33_01595 [Candidatus Kerfeldbacteria bacterium]|nr:hypothetical protein [Candidatus Kerfeldbacteria bacterium]
MLTGCTATQVPANSNKTGDTNDNTNVVTEINTNTNESVEVVDNTNEDLGTGEEVDMSDWIVFDAEENGVKKDLLADFIYPNNWYTYNIAGGSSVRIFFSDGGHLVELDKTYDEVVQDLYYSDEKEIKNECRFSVVYNGSNDEYNVYQTNTKIENVSKEVCNNIISILSKQVE